MFNKYNLLIAENAVTLKQYWHKRLVQECPEQSATTRESIVCWLLKTDLRQFEQVEPLELETIEQAMEHRWKILRQRYLRSSREGAYRNLIIRLGSLVIYRSHIPTWIASSRDRQHCLIDILQEVIQELLQNDIYLQQQMACIAEFTNDRHLQDRLLFATIEEYALRPTRNQPTIMYLFINYLRRIGRGDIIQVLSNE
ncbi:MAG: hypothetical protein RMX96_15615 [Nostoc sp. ChiSLP02]|nr:hypothetical protein [Nostoc sp. DedSLP05]MDZ8101933.1 hypothetical protein [Nostoc sp. DedSLP01]MDZ8186266.1 hypothetical protein [Nostoc sp. ChiSLP02]